MAGHGGRHAQWSDVDDKRLLFSILATHNIKLNHQAVADHMGDGRSGNAIFKHLNKIKKSLNNVNGDSEAEEEENGEADDGPATPAKKPRTPKRKSVKTEEDGEGVPAPLAPFKVVSPSSPTKKARTNGKAKNSIRVKKEQREAEE